MIQTGIACEMYHTDKYSVFEALFGTTFRCIQEGNITLNFLLNVLILELLFLITYYATTHVEAAKLNKLVLGVYGVFLVTMIGVVAYPFIDYFLLS